MGKKNTILNIIQSLCVGFFLKFLQDWVHNDNFFIYIIILILFFVILAINRALAKEE